jgi:hypothetical protein
MTRTTPYSQQPDQAFWRRAISQLPPADVDPVGLIGLSITPETRVATAGSCFAQHIARRLRQSGYNYFVTEQRPPFIQEEIATQFNYGTFSARFGNIYTSRQLRQLMERAYGEFTPQDDMWEEDDGSILDPYRPAIQPLGFLSREELRLDREIHFASVRRMLEECDLFVFTLGLTECWIHRSDGAAYPLCPGSAGGTFDADKHQFINLGVSDVVDDMRACITRIRFLNPDVSVMLTVSPVPLIATATAHHVLTATTYSKSVLRVAAEQLAAEFPGVFYFPSYEIITGSFSRGRYYGVDGRDVNEAGVDHVMRLFFRHVADFEFVGEPAAEPAETKAGFAEFTEKVVKSICDEEKLEELTTAKV